MEKRISVEINLTLVAIIVIIFLSIITTMKNIKITKVQINQEYQNQIITLEVYGHEWEYFVDNEDIKNF